jgi:protein-tyrosine phosphatase
MSTVLFLCSGNYYRSRFAEILFNWHAERRGSLWRADSRGLAIDPFNQGPLSRHTSLRLAEMGISLPEPARMPRDLEATNLEQAARVVAVKEAEHRPLMARRFPAWVDRVEYWHVHDLDCAGAETALPQLEQLVADLIARLHAAPSA